MKIRLQLILSAYIVNFGWAAFQSPSRTKNEAITGAVKDGTGIRQNFQNLFDSIANNEASRSRQYREVLREEIGKGQAAFSTLDKELVNARSLHADRKKYEHENAGVRQNVVVKKRRAVETEEFKQMFNYAYANPVEDLFIEYFGNDPRNMKRWEAVKDWFLEEGEPRLKRFCAAAHKRTFNTSNAVVGWAFLESKLLQFKNEEYLKRLVDVVLYKLELNVTYEDPVDVYSRPRLEGPWMMTEGPRPDCVFYLHFDYTTELAIKELVCGIDLNEREESDREDMPIDEKEDSTNKTFQISNETAIHQTSPNLDSDPTTNESTTNGRQNLSSDSTEMPITASPFTVTETPFSPRPPQGLLDKTLPSKSLEEWISITPRIYAEPTCVISRGFFSNVILTVNHTYINWRCEIYYCDMAGELKNYECEFLNSEAGHEVDVNLDEALKECKKVWCI